MCPDTPRDETPRGHSLPGVFPSGFPVAKFCIGQLDTREIRLQDNTLFTCTEVETNTNYPNTLTSTRNTYKWISTRLACPPDPYSSRVHGDLGAIPDSLSHLICFYKKSWVVAQSLKPPPAQAECGDRSRLDGCRL